MVDAIYEVNGLKNSDIRTGENIIVPVTRNIKKGNAKSRGEMKEVHLPSVKER